MLRTFRTSNPSNRQDFTEIDEVQHFFRSWHGLRISPVSHIKEFTRHFYIHLLSGKSFNARVSFYIFGVYWAAGIFQHSICDIFLELLSICLQIYIDNFNIYSLTRRSHLEHLRQVFSLCKEANIHLQKEKFTFMVTEIQTLGLIVSHNSLRPDPKKVDMLQKATPPKDRTDLRAFLTLLQQLRCIYVSSFVTCLP